MSLHYLGKHEHEPRKVSLFSHAVYHVSKTIALACYIFDMHQPILIFTNFNIFVENKVALFSTVCKYYFSPSHFVFETRYAA